MRWLTIFFAMILLSACVPPTATLTPTARPPTITPTSTITVTPPVSPPITPTRPPSPIITPTPPTSPLATPLLAKPTPIVGLMNPGFEELYDGVGVAQYWHYWYLPLPPCHIGDIGCAIPCPLNCNLCPYNDIGCFWAQPEWQQSPGASTGYFRVDSGHSSQKIFCYGRECEGGVYQVVNQQIRVGDKITFGLKVMAWQCFNYPACIVNYDPIHGKWAVISDRPYAMNLRVGIDPAGGTDPLAASVRWGAITESFDKFSPITVTITAPANSSKLTVFFRFGVRFDYARANNDVYIDSAWLNVESGLPNKTYLPGVWRR